MKEKAGPPPPPLIKRAAFLVKKKPHFEKKKFLLEPFTNYFVGRVEKPIINELSTVGFMATDLRRKGETNQSRVFNLDWRLNFMDNRLSFEGQAVNSLASNKSGYGGRFIFTYRNFRCCIFDTKRLPSPKNYNPIIY